MSNQLGRLIRAYRKENSLTQFDFACKIGVSEFYIGAIERGQKIPGRKTLIKLSNELDVPIESLLDIDLKYKLKIETDQIYTEISSLTPQEQRFVINIMEYIISFLQNGDKK